jgi:prolyl 4-hydroxylase
MNLRFPRVVLFENFMTSSECEFLIRTAKPNMKHSSVMSKDGTGSEVRDDVRTSSGCAFPRGDNAFIGMLDQRAAELCNWPIERGESYQVMRYQEGEQYKPHFDFFMPRAEASPPGPGGQRVATLLIYLQAPEQGGGTVFPEIGMEIQPTAGSAIFFSYPNLFYARNTLHAGLPVIAGEKWIATKWFREGPH